MSSSLALLALLALGLSAGALLAEACLLVPMWRAMAAADFLAWYARHASLLFDFFAPLEIATTLLALAAAIVWIVRALPGRALLALAAVLALAVVACFPLYFEAVNASFAAGTIPPDQVAGELARWAAWHGWRTAMCIAAFVAAALVRR